MLAFVGSANELELERNKMQYCVHKDELAVGVARPWVKFTTRTLPSSAYPSIVSNCQRGGQGLRVTEWCMKKMKYLYHFSTSLEKRAEIIAQMNNDPFNSIPVTAGIAHPYFQDDHCVSVNLRPHMINLYDFYPVGFANTPIVV